ncbi:hypothetical protein AGABI2DRAFT_146341 [Agaricus bisporus var. bisporus H97]|uniref:hypothetical protein n=1 Tax=Agaricus bisporus var. bisporus (strain H97 / ATCC MYA-4626 / FGSC 10389) TaxID=936046 RepID=UPI00029F5FCD|nr:hypothetical protein AGABI2DRAFT_146341 [Agaricus bisporus var. bisporus H97]EKV42839.1 hypothetical protein AGABI2DRAFT_146341 [Agaricus bisporus var. bisporus H97]
MTQISTAVNSFVGAVEEEKMVWGAIVEVEEVKDEGEADGFVTTRAQKKSSEGERKDNGKRTNSDRSGEVERKMIEPAYRFESKIADPEAAQQMLKRILDVEVPNIKVRDLLSLSGDLRKHMVENTRTQKAPVASSALITTPDTVEFSTPLREVEVTIMGKQKEYGLLDEGSEITANGEKEAMLGCVEYLELEVGGVKTYAHAFVVPRAPYRLLLGRPWQKGVKLGKVEREDGSMEVVITDPGEEKKVVVLTRERKPGKMKAGLAVLGGMTWGGKRLEMEGGENSLTETILGDTFMYDMEAQCLAYKKVANKVRPVPGTMPSDIRIIRKFPEDPLETLPKISPFPPKFSPGLRLTQERMDQLGLFSSEFLWEEEKKLVARVLLMNEKGLAWDETEKGRFRDEYFSPVKIPVQEHVPWTRKSLPIPPGIREKVIDLVRKKVESGVYEPSYSSYRHQWFTVAKKDGNVRIVHNLTPLNAVTIRDSQEPPLVYLYAEQCAARAIC